VYGDRQARISIATGEVLSGSLPPRAAKLVREWTSLRRAELESNWERIEAHEHQAPVEPLT